MVGILFDMGPSNKNPPTYKLIQTNLYFLTSSFLVYLNQF